MILTKTCVLLHNFFRRSNASSQISPIGAVDTYDDNGNLVHLGSWRQEVEDGGAIRSLSLVAHKPTFSATQIRKEFTAYFYNNRFYIKCIKSTQIILFSKSNG